MADKKEYIERVAFIADIQERYCKPCEEAKRDYHGVACRACWVDDMRMEIEDAPAADVVEVRHGTWTLNKDGSGTCDQCGMTQKNIWDYDNWQNYCGHCGAKMDGGRKEQT